MQILDQKALFLPQKFWSKINFSKLKMTFLEFLKEHLEKMKTPSFLPANSSNTHLAKPGLCYQVRQDPGVDVLHNHPKFVQNQMGRKHSNNVGMLVVPHDGYFIEEKLSALLF